MATTLEEDILKQITLPKGTKLSGAMLCIHAAGGRGAKVSCCGDRLSLAILSLVLVWDVSPNLHKICFHLKKAYLFGRQLD